jgi:hypothetical protein
LPRVGANADDVLAEARPTPNPLGEESFNKALLLGRARKAWEMAEVWNRAAHSWEKPAILLGDVSCTVHHGLNDDEATRVQVRAERQCALQNA